MRKVTLERATAHLAAHDRSESRTNDLNYWFARFVDWCRVNDERPIPATPDTVLVCLYSQRDYWGRDSMRQLADAVAQAHVALGYDDPTAGEVRALLAAVTRSIPPRERNRPLAPVRANDALELCATPSSAPPRLRVSTAAQRLALVAARTGGLPLRAIGRARARTDDDVVSLVLSDGTTTIVVDGDHADVGVAACRELEHHGRERLPKAAKLAAAVAASLRRAGICCGVDHILELSDDDFDTLLDWADHMYARDLRDRTLVVVGIALARRGAELSSFDVEDFTMHAAGGWKVSIRRTKTTPSTELTHYLDHSDHDEGIAWCPACALTVWIHTLETRWAHTKGVLFPLLGTGTGLAPGRLTTAQVTTIVKRLWRHGGKDTLARIGSRSLRVGGTTSAHEGGVSLQQIADLVTLHMSLDCTARYIRDDRPQFRLDV